MSFRYCVFDSGDDILMDCWSKNDPGSSNVRDVCGSIWSLENPATFVVLGPLDASQISTRETDISNGVCTTWDGVSFGTKTYATWKAKFEVNYPEKFAT